MPSELENALARHRSALLANERRAASQMVRAYGESWARIRVDILRVQAQIALTEGEPAIWRIQQDARLRSIQAQIEAELRRFAPYATQSATMTQQAAIQAASRNAGQAIEAAGGPQVTLRFDKLNAGAVETLVGYASDGSPLRALFDAIGPQVAPQMTATLAKGIALGWNPRVTAREMRAAYGVGLNRALNIARTETLRAYRSSTAQVYQANADIVEQWIWVCACDRRSCASCWAMHGSLHSLDERLDDHNQGRCAMAPKVRDRPNRIGATGAERFDMLSADDQRYIMGNGMYEAWRDGQVSMTPYGANSIVGRRDDAQWGTMRYARSLRSIVGPDAAAAYSARAAIR
jgi:SPP1 gp7 family putative phage head morphogenesis protein